MLTEENAYLGWTECIFRVKCSIKTVYSAWRHERKQRLINDFHWYFATKFWPTTVINYACTEGRWYDHLFRQLSSSFEINIKITINSKLVKKNDYETKLFKVVFKLFIFWYTNKHYSTESLTDIITSLEKRKVGWNSLLQWKVTASAKYIKLLCRKNFKARRRTRIREITEKEACARG